MIYSNNIDNNMISGWKLIMKVILIVVVYNKMWINQIVVL